jgi:hypothetical protein
MQADQEDFAAIPGLGPVKARRLLEAFSQPFKRNLTGVQGPAGVAGAAGAGAADGVAGQQQAGSSRPGQQQQQQGGEDLDFDLEDYEDEDPAAGDKEDMQQEGEEEADEPGSAAAADAGAGGGVGGSVGAADAGFGQQGRGEFLPLPPQDDEYGYDDELLEEF